jgi:hypothetical protein
MDRSYTTVTPLFTPITTISKTPPVIISFPHNFRLTVCESTLSWGRQSPWLACWTRRGFRHFWKVFNFCLGYHYSSLTRLFLLAFVYNRMKEWVPVAPLSTAALTAFVSFCVFMCVSWWLFGFTFAFCQALWCVGCKIPPFFFAFRRSDYPDWCSSVLICRIESSGVDVEQVSEMSRRLWATWVLY